ncbi:hypothetical protein [Paracoccus saliphilus]|uniref:Uncharacterized protein n=1 Tax=Paracoccus saliphilus TaxID=405559 RepID=A0ABY7SCH0_9RHOB|nr:hypothetical protein [Paracoccus saliphilus]WCR04653.1 hypothetical protein JHX88_08030 [Paracoccus saliphilus]
MRIRGFWRWLDRWSKRRAEKNRRFKIPCHLGVKKTGSDKLSDGSEQ